MIKKLILTAFCIAAFLTAVSAQTKVQVRFAKGASAATVKGSLTGYKFVDYVVGAKSGQTMSVKLSSANTFLGFTVLDGTLNNLGDSDGDSQWSGSLPADGTYTVRVLLPRSAARRKGAAASFSVRISVE